MAYSHHSERILPSSGPAAPPTRQRRGEQFIIGARFQPTQAPAMPSPSDSEELLRLARQELASGQLAAAQAKCLQVLNARQHDPGALEVLGEVLFAQGRHEDAVRVFNALTLMQPTIARHWENLGTVLRPTRRYAHALAAFERALQLGQPSKGLLYNLGGLQMERYDY